MADNVRKGLQVPRNPALALRELNRKHADGDINTTILQTDLQTDTQTIELPITPPNIQTDTLADNQTTQQPDTLTLTQTTNQPINPTEQPTANTTDTHANNNTAQPTAKQPTKRTAKPSTRLRDQPPPDPQPRTRVDGRTMRIRQDTADRTMVTSFRLTVGTIEQLDEFCWRERMRKQDVIQMALKHFFTTWDAEEE